MNGVSNDLFFSIGQSLPPFSVLTLIVLLLSCCRIRSDEEAVEEADDWSDTMPSSASVSDWLDSARSASASVMRLEVVATVTLFKWMSLIHFCS